MATIPAARRFDLTDGQWAVLEPLLPSDCGPGRSLKWSNRQLIDGIRWPTRAGCPWRDVPGWYGSWQWIYGLSGSGNGMGPGPRRLTAVASGSSEGLRGSFLHELPDTGDDLAAVQLDVGHEGFVGQAAGAVLKVEARRMQCA